MSSLATREENFSFSDGAYRESAQALTYIVANTTPETLHQKFLQASSLLVADQIDTLLPLVQELGLMPHGRLQLALNTTDVRHCVRCHQIYMEIDNGLSACLIKHSLPREAPSRSLPPSPDYMLYYHCCRQFVVPGSDFHSRLRDSYHFVGRHTTRREIVFNSTNVQQCFLCSLSNSHNRPPGTTAHGFDDSSVAASESTAPTSELGRQLVADMDDMDNFAQSSTTTTPTASSVGYSLDSGLESETDVGYDRRSHH